MSDIRPPPPVAGPSNKRPSKPPVVQPGSGNNIIINPCQRLNPVLEAVRNVGKEFGEIKADFQVGRTTGVLFLSLRYHRLHPEYIHQRIEALGHSYNLRVLLLMCDITEHQEHIRELTKICIINNITIVVAWSPDEAGQYLTTYKQFEHKPPNLIRERVERAPAALMRNALTSISKVNKTDVETLRTSFGSMAAIARASTDQLAQLPGFGPKKVTRMKDAFERPFRNYATSALAFPVLPRSQDPASAKGKEKEKEKEKETAREAGDDEAEQRAAAGPPPSPPARAREPSPVWDIELDLNSPEPAPALMPAPPAANGNAKKRAASPVWDIELDLNDDEIEEALRQTEMEPDKKRRKS